MNTNKSKSQITINGTTFGGESILVKNGQVYIDGVEIENIVNKKTKIIDVKVEGNLASLEADGSVTVHGDVLGDVDAGNSVHCGNVTGDVDAGNSVHCGDVGGEIDAGNSVYKS